MAMEMLFQIPRYMVDSQNKYIPLISANIWTHVTKQISSQIITDHKYKIKTKVKKKIYTSTKSMYVYLICNYVVTKQERS